MKDKTQMFHKITFYSVTNTAHSFKYCFYAFVHATKIAYVTPHIDLCNKLIIITP